MKLTSLKFILLSVVLGLTACFDGPGLFKQDGAESAGVMIVASEDPDGITTGEIDPNSVQTQRLAAGGSSAISGTSVAFPPGSLSIATDIRLQEGASIANSGAAVSLGLGSASKAGPAVVISSSKAVDASSPFSLSIPVSGAGLMLTSTQNLVVIYQIAKQSENAKVFTGVIPTSKLVITKDSVTFDTTYFGSYQASYVDVEITKAVEVPSTTEILTKVEENKLDPIEWASVSGAASSDRRATFSGSIKNGINVKTCAVFVDRDKSSPWDASAVVSSPAYTLTALSDSAYSVYARFECFADDGRSSGLSAWTSAVAIEAKTVPVVVTLSGTPSSISNSAVLSATVGGSRVEYYRYLVGNSVNCADFSGYSSELSVFVPITASLAAVADGTVTLCVIGRDSNSSNWQATATSVQWTKDTVAPSVNVGADVSTASSVTIDATVGGASTYAWTLVSGSPTVTFGTASAEDTTLSSTADGTFTIRLTATDSAGNSAYDELFFTWSSVPAPDPTFVINAGSSYTGTTGVSLSLTDATGVDEYRVANGTDCSSAVWTVYGGGSISHTLVSSDGTKTVCLQVRDAADVASATATDSILLDLTNPVSTTALSGTVGPNTTAGATTVISGTSSDSGSGLSGVTVALRRLSDNLYFNGSGFAGASPTWLGATGTTSWSLTVSDALLADGSYEITPQGLDVVGNLETGSVTTIAWDSTPPSAAFAINSGAASTNLLSVTIDLSTGTGVAEYRVANGSDCTGSTWTTYTSNGFSFSLNATDGTKTVCLDVRDTTGNVASNTDTIALDATNPTSTVASNGNFDSTTTAGTNTTFSGTASDTTGVGSVEIAIQRSATSQYLNAGQTAFNNASPVWHAATASGTWTISIADSLFLHSESYVISSRATDTVGNVQSSYGTNTITWVNISPTITFVEPTGANDTIFQDQSFLVSWTATDPDDDATVSLYYKPTASGACNTGSMFSGALSENSVTQYTWNTLGVSAGSYYICARITDGISTAYEAWSPSSITVNPKCTGAQVSSILSPANGDGSPSNPFVICNIDQLNDARYESAFSHLTLGNDIDASSMSAGTGWQPLFSVGTPYQGIFDGDGFTIDNLTIARPAENNVGLFADLGVGGEIRDVGLTRVSIIGQHNVGAFVGGSGSNSAWLRKSFASGAVTGVQSVGGLAGTMGSSSNLEDIYFIGSVTSSDSIGYVGGLVGAMSGTMDRGYASGAIRGTGTKKGGLFGAVSGGMTSDGFFTGHVETPGGAIVGFLNGDINNMKFHNHALAGFTSTCVGTYSTGANNCSSEATKSYFYSNAATPANSWDFTVSGPWESLGGSNYPVLRWQAATRSVFYIPPQITCFDAHLDSVNPGINYGSGTSLLMHGGSGGTKILMQPAIDGIAGITTFDVVEMKMPILSNALGTVQTMNVRKLDAAFPETTATYSNFSSVNATVSGSSSLPTGTGSPFFANLSSLATNWFNYNYAYFGFAIVPNSMYGATNTSFYSSEGAIKPELHIMIDGLSYFAQCVAN